MRLFGYFIAVGALSAVAGCAGMENETEPVQVNTAKGVVTCQLYLPEVVMLDESIAHPSGMSLEEADDICRQEGVRVMNEYMRNQASS